MLARLFVATYERDQPDADQSGEDPAAHIGRILWHVW
jgi:hypothetical protein